MPSLAITENMTRSKVEEHGGQDVDETKAKANPSSTDTDTDREIDIAKETPRSPSPSEDVIVTVTDTASDTSIAKPKAAANLKSKQASLVTPTTLIPILPKPFSTSASASISASTSTLPTVNVNVNVNANGVNPAMVPVLLQRPYAPYPNLMTYNAANVVNVNAVSANAKANVNDANNEDTSKTPMKTKTTPLSSKKPKHKITNAQRLAMIASKISTNSNSNGNASTKTNVDSNTNANANANANQGQSQSQSPRKKRGRPPKNLDANIIHSSHSNNDKKRRYSEDSDSKRRQSYNGNGNSANTSNTSGNSNGKKNSLSPGRFLNFNLSSNFNAAAGGARSSPSTPHSCTSSPHPHPHPHLHPHGASSSSSGGNGNSSLVLSQAEMDVVKWEHLFFELVLYKHKKGDCNVPVRYVTKPNNEGLGLWVQTVRSQYKLKKSNSKKHIFLDDRHIAALNAIGFIWDVREDNWDKRFQELKDYKQKYGDCHVPTAKSDLGRWVNAQRVNYQDKLTKNGTAITQEHIDRLESIGFVWKFRTTMCWEDRFKQLETFRQEHGHCIVPQHYQKDHHFGRWVSKQREQYRLLQAGKPSQITEERVKRLDSLGMVWNAKKWRDMRKNILDDSNASPIPYKSELNNNSSSINSSSHNLDSKFSKTNGKKITYKYSGQIQEQHPEPPNNNNNNNNNNSDTSESNTLKSNGFATSISTSSATDITATATNASNPKTTPATALDASTTDFHNADMIARTPTTHATYAHAHAHHNASAFRNQHPHPQEHEALINPNLIHNSFSPYRERV